MPAILDVSCGTQVPAAIDAACGRIPPLWPLQNFVAVNPFLGLTDMTFEQASRLLERVSHKAILMDSDYYLSLLSTGAIQAEDISAAFADCVGSVPPSSPVSWLEEELQRPERSFQLLTVADWLDRAQGANWTVFVTDEISKWCASYFDRGQSSWAMPWRDKPLYEAWRQAALADANPEIFGLRDFRAFVRQLPESQEEAIAQMLRALDVPEELVTDFLHRELISIFGWSAYAACQDRQSGSRNFVRAVLAIRLAYDSALHSNHTGWSCESRVSQACNPARYIAQSAAERAFRRGLSRKIKAVPITQPAARKSMQAVFCIDVRSEVYRRALEAQHRDIQTIGFAGFFGIAVEFDSSARCPVLLSPAYKVSTTLRESGWSRLAERASAVWKTLSTSASGCFSSVELGGAVFAVSLLKKLTGLRNSGSDAPPVLIPRIPTVAAIELVAAALNNMTLDPTTLAPIVLICGHGSRTENNPYGSSLDCGACGGHKGDVNARVAASLMNAPDIREGLRQRGIPIPDDTVFVAGLHITTTDEVILYDVEHLPEQKRNELLQLLERASAQARRQRNNAPNADSRQLEREIRRRSSDWSEVRPEWGLAGNAAFIAAPRTRTRGIDLGGRVFLHDYDAAADPDSSVLTLILTAPVIVASWINLQYYGSVVNNSLFGSGNKVLHNVVGTFGVWEGNAGDLRTGLPIQSLHDGIRWVHQPLRLQVFVEAPRQRIDAVLEANQGVLRLVQNDWIHMIAIEGGAFFEWRPGAAWREYTL